MVGSDFSSLEDHISALLTKDTNKLKVYLPNDYIKITVNDVIHNMQKDDLVYYDGITYTAGEFYEKYKDSEL